MWSYLWIWTKSKQWYRHYIEDWRSESSQKEKTCECTYSYLERSAKCRIYKLRNIYSWKATFGSTFKKDDYQQKLWHTGSSRAFRHKKFSKPAKEIKEIKIERKKRIKLYQKETYSEKEKANLHEESIKYDLSEVLKNETIPGPFTTEKEIRDYLELEQDEKNQKQSFIQRNLIC